MYWLGTAEDKTDQMGLSSSADLLHWNEETDEPILPRRPGKFDSRVVEPGPPPIVTRDGIVLIYNGADDHLVYRTGIAIFDRRDPRGASSRCSSQNENGRNTGRCQTLCSSRAWPRGEKMAVLLRRSR